MFRRRRDVYRRNSQDLLENAQIMSTLFPVPHTCTGTEARLLKSHRDESSHYPKGEGVRIDTAEFVQSTGGCDF